ncbi:DUF4232 domain-containing protein [Kitasatospora sp. NPDC088391]|uniref:DUF4232 domain-containing protein n=1 Tax=Kitasatospora sp. NPDC088391 TaxID=3364074 RepID=UPI003808A3CB
MRVRKLTFAVLAATAALTLTACQDDETGTAAQGAPAAGQKSAAPSTAATSAAPAKGSTPPAAGSAKAGECRTADLTVTAADRTIGGDADRTVVVEFKNHSGKDCTVSGYAGVDLKTSAGTVSAKRSGEPVVAGVLKNGKSTYFGISYPANTSGGTGLRITGLVVTPPDETRSVTLAWPGAASLPVTEGTDSPVKVGPIGSAGQGE